MLACQLNHYNTEAKTRFFSHNLCYLSYFSKLILSKEKKKKETLVYIFNNWQLLK